MVNYYEVLSIYNHNSIHIHTGNEYYNVIPLLNSDETFEHKTFHNLNESHMDFLRNNIDVPRLTTILQLKKQNSTIWNDLKEFRLINLQKFIYFKCFGHMRWS